MPTIPAVRPAAAGLTLVVVLTLGTIAFGATSIEAQGKTSPPRAGAKERAATKGSAAAPAIVGTWSGTATVPLKDSSLVVPVIYTFTQTGSTIGGTATVPGQGAGPISDVTRDGGQLRWRVTAPEGRILEHDGAFTPDGAIEGMVNLDKQPVARFRIVPRKGDASTRGAESR